MAGTVMNVTIDDDALQKRIRRLQQMAGGVRPALTDIGEYMVRETDDRFTQERDPEGNPWEPLKLRTIYGSHRGRKYTKKGQLTKRFAKYAARRKILTDTHRLRDSIVYQIVGDAVVIGTNVVYGRVHQEGADFSILSTRARVQIPARPYLGVNDENHREFNEILKAHVLEAL